MWSLLAPRQYPAAKYDDAWRDINFWDEHTWGADKSVSDPDLPLVKQEWAFKRRFAVDAAHSAEELLARAAQTSHESSGKRAVFDIYNLSSWPRTDVVRLSAEQSAAGDRVTDEGGQLIPSQRLTTGELAVLVQAVLPLSAKRIFIGKGAAFQRGSASAKEDSLENADIALHVSSQTGAIDTLFRERIQRRRRICQAFTSERRKADHFSFRCWSKRKLQARKSIPVKSL
jgi:alpha-mannosidase